MLSQGDFRNVKEIKKTETNPYHKSIIIMKKIFLYSTTFTFYVNLVSQTLMMIQ